MKDELAMGRPSSVIGNGKRKLKTLSVLGNEFMEGKKEVKESAEKMILSF